MKKIIAILLSLILVLSLCACGSDAPARGEQIDHGKDSGSKVTEDDKIEETDEVEETDEIEETEDVQETEDEEPTEEDETGLVLGEMSGLTYESEFIGIGCNLPEGWSFYSDEQMRELNQITIDASPEEYKELMESAAVIYDMFAADPTGTNNINVTMEKVSNLQLMALDLKQNFENTIPMLQATYENMGASDVQCEIDTITIDGEEFTCMYSMVDLYGVTLYQCLIAIKCNGYLANVTVTACDEESFSELMDYLYLV